jgi:Tn3 transposase DDE domain
MEYEFAGRRAQSAQTPLCPQFSRGICLVASTGLNLVVAAIILWNTVYLERASGALCKHGRMLDTGLFKHVAPVHWDHINLTGDYIWRQNKRVEKGGFRSLRPMPLA